MTTSPSKGLAGGLYRVGDTDCGKVGMLEARVSVGPFINPATLLLNSSCLEGDGSLLLKDANTDAGLQPVCGGGGKTMGEGCICQEDNMTEDTIVCVCFLKN